MERGGEGDDGGGRGRGDGGRAPDRHNLERSTTDPETPGRAQATGYANIMNTNILLHSDPDISGASRRLREPPGCLGGVTRGLLRSGSVTPFFSGQNFSAYSSNCPRE